MNDNNPPKLVRRREHKKSTIMSGRTIGEAREHLETANERAAARKKDKRKRTTRIIIISVCFVILIGILIVLLINFVTTSRESLESEPEPVVLQQSFIPTVPIEDESSFNVSDKISTRMKEYIGMLEADFRDLNYTVTKAIIPSNSIREVDILLEGHPGYFKTVIDRGSAVTAEDADRMIRYLSSQGIESFEYVDVRIDGKAFWK